MPLLSTQLHKRFSLGTHCPNCGQFALKPNRVNTLVFCPNCDIVLAKQSAVCQHKQLPLWQRVIVSVVVFCMYLMISQLVDFAAYSQTIGKLIDIIIVLFLGYLVCMLVLLIVRGRWLNGQYVAGIDTLQEVKNDSCDYTVTVSSNNQIKPLRCKTCGSFRLVNLYWYKRILTKDHNRTTLPNIVKLDDNDTFVGCVHCESQFELKKNISHFGTKTQWVFVILLSAVAILPMLFSVNLDKLADVLPAIMPLKEITFAALLSLYFFMVLSADRAAHSQAAQSELHLLKPPALKPPVLKPPAPRAD